MVFENRRKILLIVPICIAISMYTIPFNGKQVISLDAPLQATFDVLVQNLWKFHPFIIHVNELKKINSTCSYYEITDSIPFIPSLKINIPTTYYVEMNIDQTNNCITSLIYTKFNIMQAYHQYCIHENTLKETAVIVTDQFHGTSWMIFKSYIRKNMLISHKQTLEKLRKEMMIYAND